MKTLTFTIDINASAARVYATMIGEETSKEWISIFSPNSFFKGS